MHSFAVLLETKNVPLVGVLPGVVNTGPITLSGGGSPILGYQAYSSQPTDYTFYCILNLQAGDSAFSQALFTVWNTGLNKRDTLGYGGVLLTSNMATYTQVTVPINWMIVGVPDSIQLTFATSIKGSAAPVGTQFYVDDVDMITSTGVQSLSANGTFVNVYPNPTTSYVTFGLNDEKAKYADIYDLTGKKLASVELTGKVTKVDVSSYDNGMYIYVITDAQHNKLSTSKFNVAK